MTKPTYLDSKKKHLVRSIMLRRVKKFNRVVGLAGPDINQYLDTFKNMGVEEFEVYEKDKQVFINQLRTIRGHRIQLKYMDILKADADAPKTLFDLDFCATIKHLKEHVVKFKDNFIMTFSLRGFSEKDTLKSFFSWRGEQICETERVKCDSLWYNLIHTKQGGSYLQINYFDTSPMFCISKL